MIFGSFFTYTGGFNLRMQKWGHWKCDSLILSHFAYFVSVGGSDVMDLMILPLKRQHVQSDKVNTNLLMILDWYRFSAMQKGERISVKISSSSKSSNM